VPVRRESLNQFELTNRVHDTFQLSALTQMVLDTVNPITYQPNRKSPPAIVASVGVGMGWKTKALMTLGLSVLRLSLQAQAQTADKPNILVWAMTSATGTSAPITAA
jgi:hypothetical protein